jgi:predicted Zn-dependent protease
MENMREYWAREAEMMRDKSGVLGYSSFLNNDSDDSDIKNLDVLDIPKKVGYEAEIKVDQSKKLTLQVDFKIKPSIKVIKCTNSGFENYQINAYLPDLKKFLDSIFSFSYTINEYEIGNDLKTGTKLAKNQAKNWKIVCNFNASYDINVANSISDIKSSDLIIAVVDSIGSNSVDESGFKGVIRTAGFHTAGGRIMVLSKSDITGKSKNAIRLIAHEEGHRLGLSHDHNSGGIMSYATMYQSSNISQGQQKGLAFGAFYGPYSALKFKVGKFSVSPAFGDAKTELVAWLDEASRTFNELSYKKP